MMTCIEKDLISKLRVLLIPEVIDYSHLDQLIYVYY